MKRILSIAAILVAMLGICACGDTPKPEGNEVDEYAELNDMLAMHYSKIDLTVTNTFEGGFSLVSDYTITYSDDAVTVNYTIERFAETSLDIPASEIKTTLRGEAAIKDGAVTILSGQSVDLDANIAERGFTFKEEYFSNADKTGIYLKADVSNASAFMGAEMTCTDMKIDATFLDFFYSIKISYKAGNGSSVSLTYDFTV